VQGLRRAAAARVLSVFVSSRLYLRPDSGRTRHRGVWLSHGGGPSSRCPGLASVCQHRPGPLPLRLCGAPDCPCFAQHRARFARGCVEQETSPRHVVAWVRILLSSFVHGGRPWILNWGELELALVSSAFQTTSSARTSPSRSPAIDRISFSVCIFSWCHIWFYQTTMPDSKVLVEEHCSE